MPSDTPGNVTNQLFQQFTALCAGRYDSKSTLFGLYLDVFQSYEIRHYITWNQSTISVCVCECIR